MDKLQLENKKKFSTTEKFRTSSLNTAPKISNKVMIIKSVATLIGVIIVGGSIIILRNKTYKSDVKENILLAEEVKLQKETNNIVLKKDEEYLGYDVIDFYNSTVYLCNVIKNESFVEASNIGSFEYLLNEIKVDSLSEFDEPHYEATAIMYSAQFMETLKEDLELVSKKSYDIDNVEDLTKAEKAEIQEAKDLLKYFCESQGKFEEFSSKMNDVIVFGKSEGAVKWANEFLSTYESYKSTIKELKINLQIE